MKYIYKTSDLRIKIKENYNDFDIILRLQIINKNLFFSKWITMDKLLIDIRYYWGYPRLGPRPLLCNVGFGLSTLEIWPPDIFNLKNRIEEMFSDYYKTNKIILEQRNAIKKQIKSLK
jgi:hypothetical protein